MTYLHSKQHMAHLDLKSPNVLLKGKDAKLADFGSLRRLRVGGRGPRRPPPTAAHAQAVAAAAEAGGAAARGGGGGGGAEGPLPFEGVGGVAESQAALMARVQSAVLGGNAEAAVSEMRQLGLTEDEARQVTASLDSHQGGAVSLGGSSGSYAEQEGGIGTPEWLAPELLSVEAPGTPGRQLSMRGVDWQAADRYSFAVILWELLSRKRPCVYPRSPQLALALIAVLTALGNCTGTRASVRPRPSPRSARRLCRSGLTKVRTPCRPCFDAPSHRLSVAVDLCPQGSGRRSSWWGWARRRPNGSNSARCAQATCLPHALESV